jgi:hypothetical protein
MASEDNMTAPFTVTTDSASISNTEYFLASDSTSASYQTTACKLRVLVDLSDLIAGDQFRLRIYEKVNGGTAAVVYEAYRDGTQGRLWAPPEIWVNEGWEVSIIRTAGTDATIAWALKKDVGDTNVVGWLGTAPATPTVAGVPEVDVTHWIGTAAATPTVAGVPEVDVTHWIGTAAATPTVAGVPEVDVTHWIGTAAATPTIPGVPEVDVTHFQGTIMATPTVAGIPKAEATVGGTIDANVVSIEATPAGTIRDAILDWTPRAGRTLRGHWRRMDALFFGKITGFIGALVTAYRPGGVVEEFEAVQNTTAGSRDEVDVTDSEIP